jgi:sterol desaturase/sphingolipid hydroxylase (fatty acid hydroxylase superfamily)
MLLLILFELAVGVSVMLRLVSGPMAITTAAVAILVLTWNWWIHRSYHQNDHWLNSFEWFRIEKQRHFVHHTEPARNYGIASHFNDWVFGTWLEPEEIVAAGK